MDNKCVGGGAKGLSITVDGAHMTVTCSNVQAISTTTSRGRGHSPHKALVCEDSNYNLQIRLASEAFQIC